MTPRGSRAWSSLRRWPRSPAGRPVSKRRRLRFCRRAHAQPPQRCLPAVFCCFLLSFFFMSCHDLAMNPNCPLLQFCLSPPKVQPHPQSHRHLPFAPPSPTPTPYPSPCSSLHSSYYDCCNLIWAYITSACIERGASASAFSAPCLCGLHIHTRFNAHTLLLLATYDRQQHNLGTENIYFMTSHSASLLRLLIVTYALHFPSD
jgi:hypothetical protein